MLFKNHQEPNRDLAPLLYLMKRQNPNIYYTKFKRNKLDSCNICKRTASLTWDHVPPRGAVEVYAVEQKTILEHLISEKRNKFYSISQNGVKYRTICKVCNNDLLGLKYDPALNDLSNGISRFLKTKLEIPPVIKYETKPNLIIRAIVGHLLAAKGHFENTIIDEQLRNFFLDESADFPNNLKVFYWIYPYPFVVVIRDVVMPAIRGNFTTKGCFSILKYFPLAFLISDITQYENLDDLTFYYDNDASKVINIPIKLKQIKHPEWPEIIDDNNFLIGGQSLESSVFAKPKP